MKKNVVVKKRVKPLAEEKNKLPEPIFSIPPDWVNHGDVLTLNTPKSWDIEENRQALERFLERTGAGEGVKIGNGDTGVREEHEEINHAFISAKDFTGSRTGYRDYNSHGQWCCGKNVGKNLGIARNSKLHVAKVLGDRGSGTSDGILRGCEWLVEQGCKVISLSLGSSQSYSPMGDFIRRATEEEGVVFVAAAGNAGYQGRSTVGWPAKNREAVSVAAYRQDGQIANFSSGGQKIELAAPGQQTISASINGPNAYTSMSGTSMATPFAAGVIACLMSYARGLGYADIKDYNVWHKTFEAVAKDAGAPGKDVRFGYGILDYDKILEYFDLNLQS